VQRPAAAGGDLLAARPFGRDDAELDVAGPVCGQRAPLLALAAVGRDDVAVSERDEVDVAARPRVAARVRPDERERADTVVPARPPRRVEEELLYAGRSRSLKSASSPGSIEYVCSGSG
jgi:hypothetical protein